MECPLVVVTTTYPGIKLQNRLNRQKINTIMVGQPAVISFSVLLHSAPLPTSVVCHAEMNAIVNRTSTGFNLQDCTIYTTLSPCVECAKLIVQSGIKEVVYGREYKDHTKTEKLMERAHFGNKYR